MNVTPEDLRLFTEHVRKTMFECALTHERPADAAGFWPTATPEYRFQHTLHVRGFVERLQAEDGGDLELLRTAAIFHDISHFCASYDQHGRVSAEMARDYLAGHRSTTGAPFAAGFIDRVYLAIDDHASDKPDSYYLSEVPLESMILIEADLLDKLGPTGVVTHLLMAGSTHKFPPEAAGLIERMIGRGERALGNDGKRFHLTPAGRRLIRERIAWAMDFLVQMTRDGMTSDDEGRVFAPGELLIPAVRRLVLEAGRTGAAAAGSGACLADDLTRLERIGTRFGSFQALRFAAEFGPEITGPLANMLETGLQKPGRIIDRLPRVVGPILSIGCGAGMIEVALAKERETARRMAKGEGTQGTVAPGEAPLVEAAPVEAAGRGAGPDVVGLDPSPVNVRIATSLAHQANLGGRVEFVEGKAEHLPFEAGRFGAALFVQSLHEATDPKAWLEEARRVLVPGGTILIIEDGVGAEQLRLPGLGLKIEAEEALLEVWDHGRVSPLTLFVARF